MIILLNDRNREGLRHFLAAYERGHFLATDSDCCGNKSIRRWFQGSESKSDTLIGVAEEVATVQEGCNTATIKGIGAGIPAAIGKVQAEVVCAVICEGANHFRPHCCKTVVYLAAVRSR
jgi:hypothetical protein